MLRYDEHLTHSDYRNLGYPDFSWHGVKAWQPESGHHNLTAAFMLNGRYAETDGVPDDFIYVAMNMHWEMHGFELPQAPADIAEPGKEPLIDSQKEILVGPRSIIILVGRSDK